MNYRLGFDLGSTSIGWAVLKLNNENREKIIHKYKTSHIFYNKK